jgi:hypothetical protein
MTFFKEILVLTSLSIFILGGYINENIEAVPAVEQSSSVLLPNSVQELFSPKINIFVESKDSIPQEKEKLQSQERNFID